MAHGLWREAAFTKAERLKQNREKERWDAEMSKQNTVSVPKLMLQPL